MTVPRTQADAQDSRSLHERIAADLRAEIMAGDLAPGENLPSTARLKERFEASSATIQKAMQLLKDERLVIGRSGLAVIVREHRQRTSRPAGLATRPVPAPRRPLVNSRRSEGQSRFLEVRETVPPADISAAMNIQNGTAALLRRHVLEVDGEPVELVKSYYPLELARGTAIMERRGLKGGTPALLAELGHPPRLSIDRVSARVPTQEQYDALRLPTSLPVLRTLRVVYSDHERPVEVTELVKAGHLSETEYEFTPA
ncbi:GntR family transcriptional regulator [Streptomyces gamaensis]|uniref:GntR family transcriptional regulator n=1 Tax=Streptomyces gamaensis TaxID=1763542 RepID=A0ABW0YW94_9ACTN